jgi:hypothetical protein
VLTLTLSGRPRAVIGPTDGSRNPPASLHTRDTRSKFLLETAPSLHSQSLSFTWNECTENDEQPDFGAHVRSDVAVAGVSFSLEAQAPRIFWHVRSEVDEGAAAWNCTAVHTARVAHTRFDVGVGAVFWNSSAVHVLRSVHSRSLVSVTALLSYWLPLHAVMGLHKRSRWLLPDWISDTASYWLLVQGGDTSLHTRFADRVGAVASYCSAVHCKEEKCGSRCKVRCR